jgi:hypothetical protein
VKRIREGKSKAFVILGKMLEMIKELKEVEIHSQYRELKSDLENVMNSSDFDVRFQGIVSVAKVTVLNSLQ